MQDERESVKNRFSIDEREEVEMSMGKKNSSHSRNYDAGNVKFL